MATMYSDESLSAYFESIRCIPLITRHEEKLLAQKISQGDKRALKRLIEGNLRLVVRIAKSMWAPPHSLMDLIQDGNLGLMKAAEKFDAHANVKFSSYAVWWIKQSISRSLINTGQTIRIPHRKADGVKRFKAIRFRLQSELAREPNDEEIASEIGCSTNDLTKFCYWSMNPISLYQSDDDNLAIIDVFEDWSFNPEYELEKKSLAWQVDFLLNVLDSRQKEVIARRFGIKNKEPESLKIIGGAIGCSAETVRHIEKHAIRIMHDAAVNHCTVSNLVQSS